MHNLSENFEEESDGLVQLEKLRGALTEFSQKRLKTEFQILFLETEKYFQNIEEDLPLIVLSTEQLKMHLSFIIFSLNCYAPRNSKLTCTCKDCHQLNH